MNTSHSPIPPPLGVGRKCELRSPGLSMRESLWPNLAIKAAQIALIVQLSSIARMLSVTDLYIMCYCHSFLYHARGKNFEP